MSERISPAKWFLLLLAAVVGLFLATPPIPAEPTPGKQDQMVTQMVCQFLQRGHLRKPEINDDLSRRLFRRFLKDLDPAKLYFLQSDIDDLKKQETELDDQLLKGDLSFARKAYDLLLTRIGQRQKLVEELVAATHDFTANESIETDFDAMNYAKSDDEMRERWRKQIKFDLLVQRVGPKPLAEAEAKQKVLTRYQGVLKRWKQVDGNDLMELYLADLTACIDPHSTYMSPSTLDDFEIAMRLNLDGIGAVLRSENGQTIVAEVVPGGAAAKDGRLKAEDKIVAVAQGDGKYEETTDRKLRDVVKLIRGARGTKVQLKVVSTGKIEPAVIDLTRQKIELKSQEARSEIVEDGKKADGTPYRIGIIDLPSFYADPGSGKDDRKSATEDVRKILKDFEAKKVDGVVLDLRHNGGGLLSEALSLTGLFIDQGPIVQVKDSRGLVQHRDDPEKGTAYSGPLMVLVSRSSASASEILAGALQDYRRALLVGDSTTFGKGTVQSVIDLGERLQMDPPPKLGALKLTIQQFYRVNGDSTQNHGVVPDVIVPSLTEQLATAEKELEESLPFDHIKAIDHDDAGLIADGLKATLTDNSSKRVKESADFAKLAKEVERLKARKARKTLPLNEKELADLLAKDDEDKKDPKIKDLTTPETAPSETAYKFKRNFLTNEFLQIMEDYLQEKK